MTKKLALLSLLAIPFLLARSDEPTPEGVGHWSASALGHVTQSLSADAASDPHHLAVKQLTDYPNESFLLVQREADGQPEWHETQADVFFVQSGSATLVVGAWAGAEGAGFNQLRGASSTSASTPASSHQASAPFASAGLS